MAQRNLSPARTTAADGYREAVADGGEALDVISEPGLERIARFLAHFVTRADAAVASAINP